MAELYWSVTTVRGSYCFCAHLLVEQLWVTDQLFLCQASSSPVLHSTCHGTRDIWTSGSATALGKI